MPSPEVLAQHYVEMAPQSPAHTLETSYPWRVVREILLRRAASTSPFSVLDVGCGTGEFLMSLPPGWRVAGIEPNAASRAALTPLSLRIIGERLDVAGPDNAHAFDAVCLFDVLEHLPDPCGGMRAALSFVRPGGSLFISTGDMDSWTWGLLKGRHWYLASPDHISIASPQFFRFFCDREGALTLRLHALPHKRAGIIERTDDTMAVIFFALQGNPSLAARIVRKAIITLPRFRPLMHHASMPYAQSLTDHLLAEITTPSPFREAT